MVTHEANPLTMVGKSSGKEMQRRKSSGAHHFKRHKPRYSLKICVPTPQNSYVEKTLIPKVMECRGGVSGK